MNGRPKSSAIALHLVANDRVDPEYLTGRRFGLRVSTVAIDTVDGKRVALRIPPGDTVKVTTSGAAKNDWLVEVLWNGRAVTMLSRDIIERGYEISERTALA